MCMRYLKIISIKEFTNSYYEKKRWKINEIKISASTTRLLVILISIVFLTDENKFILRVKIHIQISISSINKLNKIIKL